MDPIKSLCAAMRSRQEICRRFGSDRLDHGLQQVCRQSNKVSSSSIKYFLLPFVLIPDFKRILEKAVSCDTDSC